MLLLLFCCLPASYSTWLTEVHERPFLQTGSIILVKVSDDCVLPVGAGSLWVLLLNLFSHDIADRVCVLSTLISFPSIKRNGSSVTKLKKKWLLELLITTFARGNYKESHCSRLW